MPSSSASGLYLPAAFTRSQIVAAFAALDFDNDLVAGIQVTANQIDVQLFVPGDDGGVIEMLGENASIVVTIPVDEDR